MRQLASFDENIIFLGLSNSAMNEAAKKKGLRYANEVFADRAYNDDGTLVSRKLEGALIHDEKFSYQTRDKNDKRKQSYKHKWQRN